MSLPLLDQGHLDELAGRAVPELANLGLGAGDSVVVVARNRLELIVVDTAASALGAAVVHVDPDGSAADADRALVEARPCVVVCEHAEQAPFVRERAPGAVVVVLAGGDAGACGAPVVPWSQLAGDTAAPSAVKASGPERVLCEAHLSVDGTGDALHRLLVEGAAVALARPSADPHAVLAVRPTTLVTTAARLDSLARELRRRAPVRGDGDPHPLRWAVIAALPSLAWAAAAAPGLGSASGRATAATAAALVVAAASLAFGRWRPVVLAVAAGAAVALACDAVDVAPSLVAAGRFTAATVPVAALAAGLARASREVAWTQAVAATGAPVGVVRADIGRFVGRQVRAALGLPTCRRVLVVGVPPSGAAVGDLAVTGLAIATVEPDSSAASPHVLVSTAGEVP